MVVKGEAAASSRAAFFKRAQYLTTLVVQAEHGPDSQAVLVALPGVDVAAVQAAVEQQCNLLPRADMTRRALTHSRIVQVDSKEEAAAFSNRCSVTAWCVVLNIIIIRSLSTHPQVRA